MGIPNSITRDLLQTPPCASNTYAYMSSTSHIYLGRLQLPIYGQLWAQIRGQVIFAESQIEGKHRVAEGGEKFVRRLSRDQYAIHILVLDPLDVAAPGNEFFK